MIIGTFGSENSVAKTKMLVTAFSPVMYENLIVPDVSDVFKVH